MINKVAKRAKRALIAQENKEIVFNKRTTLNIQKPITLHLKQIFKMPDLSKHAQIQLMQGTTNQAIAHFYNSDQNIRQATFNFASSRHVGGGYLNGAMAQEEELCRTIIDLYPSLATDGSSYPPGTFNWWQNVKYLSNLHVHREDDAQSNGNYNILQKSIPVSIITVAAPNLNAGEQLNIFRENPKVIFDELKQIIKLACMSPIIIGDNINVLILGALGCGAFAPSDFIQTEVLGSVQYTHIIANIFIDVLLSTQNLLSAYDCICFAIPKGPNYDAFLETFTTNKIKFLTI